MYTTTKKIKDEFSVRPQTFKRNSNGSYMYCFDIEEYTRHDDITNTDTLMYKAYIVYITETLTAANIKKTAIDYLWGIDNENELQNNAQRGTMGLYATKEENDNAIQRYKDFLNEVSLLKVQIDNDFNDIN
jgi:hypothetical protein